MERIVSLLVVGVILCGRTECTCRVDEIQVQDNFDINQFMGRWYEQMWLTTLPADQRLHDYQHTYYLHPDSKTISAFVDARYPTPPACRHYINEVKVGATPGMLLYKSATSTVFEDYWVVSTDYSTYAVVYGCQAPDAAGLCPTDQTDAVVWSRTPELPADRWTIVDGVLVGLCLNKSEYAVIPQTNDCAVDSACAIYSISDKLQAGFDMEQFMGVWVEQSWVPYANHPGQSWMYTDFQHHYVLHQDGATATVFIEARKKIIDSTDIGDCLYFTAALQTTTIPGKLQFRRKVNETATITSDYWIVSTDYTSYAFVYGCRPMSETGHCEAADSWVWTRAQTLPADKQALIASLKEDVCINSTAYVATQQTNECEETHDCTVASIGQRVLTDFDITRYMGRWYEHAWVDPYNSTEEEVYQDYQQTYSLDAKQTTITVDSRGRLPTDMDQCFQQSHLLITSGTAGQLLIKTNVTDPNLRTYWVMGTDYTSYAVVYGCRETDAAGYCRTPESWIWSREPRMDEAILTVVDELLDSICVSYDIYHKSHKNDDCHPITSGAARREDTTWLLMLAIATVCTCLTFTD